MYYILTMYVFTCLIVHVFRAKNFRLDNCIWVFKWLRSSNVSLWRLDKAYHVELCMAGLSAIRPGWRLMQVGIAGLSAAVVGTAALPTGRGARRVTVILFLTLYLPGSYDDFMIGYSLYQWAGRRRPAYCSYIFNLV